MIVYPLPARQRPSAAARVGSVAASAGLALAAFICSLMAVTAASRPEDTPTAYGVAFMAALVPATLIFFRYDVPLILGGASCGFAILLSGDTVAGLIALTVVIARRPARQAWLLGTGVIIATAVVTARDYARPPAERMWSGTETGTPIPLWVQIAIPATAILVSVGWGLVRRYARRVGSLEVDQDRHIHEAHDLRTQLTRQEERDLIAREVHDSLAGRLSQVALTSGALEVTTSEPEVRAVVQGLRTAANQALEDLRDLIGVLRNPAKSQADNLEAQIAASTTEDIATLLTQTRRSGTPMVATAILSAPLSSVLSHAVYRILQEALTNARKHAPGAAVDVDLTGAPDAGVHLVVSNPLPGSPPGPAGRGTIPAVSPGTGHGITGMHERVSALGGRARIGAIDGAMIVDVWLPWSVH